MKTNFNTTNYSTNFKAHFSNDEMTKKTLEKMLLVDPISTLALKMALEDDPSNHSICAKQTFDEVFKNKIVNNFALYNESKHNTPMYKEENIKDLLINVCKNEKQGNYDSFLNFSAQKLPWYGYMKKASELFTSSIDTNLIAQKCILEQQMSQLKNKIYDVNLKLKNNIQKVAEKHIF